MLNIRYTIFRDVIIVNFIFLFFLSFFGVTRLNAVTISQQGMKSNFAQSNVPLALIFRHFL